MGALNTMSRKTRRAMLANLMAAGPTGARVPHAAADGPSAEDLLPQAEAGSPAPAAADSPAAGPASSHSAAAGPAPAAGASGTSPAASSAPGAGSAAGSAGPASAPASSASPASEPPRRRPGAARKGAVGAISSAVSSMRANAVMELDPAMIRGGGLADRLAPMAEQDEALRRSIAAHGQQVPVLVRPHPTEPEAWQIVYGRRRVLAARELGIRVKALVRDLDDEALVIAQGQENAARLDLSFIEKANFARQMRAAGYPRSAVCDALASDKTLISRMLSAVERIPVPVLHAVGAAHGVGRPRWLALADLIESSGLEPEALAEIARSISAHSSVERFDGLTAHLKALRRAARAPAAAPAPQEVHAADGARLATARRERGGALSLSLAQGDGFDEWLLSELPALHARWKAGG